MRTIAVILTFVIGVSVPKFGLFVNLLGAMSGTILAFVMPVIIYNKVYGAELSHFRQFLHFALIVFGVVVGTMATTISLFELIKAFGQKTATELTSVLT